MNPYTYGERKTFDMHMRYPELSGIQSAWWTMYCAWDKWESDHEDD